MPSCPPHLLENAMLAAVAAPSNRETWTKAPQHLGRNMNATKAMGRKVVYGMAPASFPAAITTPCRDGICRYFGF